MLSGLKDVLRQNFVRKRAQIHHEKSWVPDSPQETAMASVEIKPKLLPQVNANSNDIAKYYKKIRVTKSVKLLKVIPEVEDESAESTESYGELRKAPVCSPHPTRRSAIYSHSQRSTSCSKSYKKLHKMLNMGNRFH